MANHSIMRFISLCVLLCFVGTLGAPLVHAQTSSSAAAAQMAEGAKSGLSLLWFNWQKYIQQAAKPTLDHAGAIDWFKTNGATARQAELLALNASAEGHLTTKLPTAGPPAAAATAQSQGNIFTRFFNKITGNSAATSEAAVAGTGSSLISKVKSVFQGAGTAATSGQYPTPQSFLKSTNAVQGGAAVPASAVQVTPQDVAAGISSTAQKAKIMMGMEPAPVAAEANAGFFAKFKTGVQNAGSKIASGVKAVGQKIKAGAQKVALTTKRGVSDASGAVRAGTLTAADKLAFWQNYYKIPVTDTIGIKVRGELSYTTKFTNKGWVVDTYSTSTKLPAAGESANALFQLDTIQAATQPAKMGIFSKIASSIKNGWNSVKMKIQGHKPLTAEAKTELGKIQIENSLLEKARTLNEVSASIEQRISNLEQTANSLKRPVNSQEIDALRETQRYVNEQKKVLERKLTEVHDGKAMTVVKDAAKWALYSVGITAGINIAKQVFSGEGIDLKAAFAFMGQPQFWGGVAGGFAGSMAGSMLGNMLLGGLVAGMPPGIGLFFRVLPGFIGAALGFEFGGSLFGGQMDLAGTLVQTVASAGGYTAASMIWTAMMGTGAPGIVLIAAAIASGMLANFLFNKFRGDPTMESYELPEQPIVPPAASDTAQEPVEQVVETPRTGLSLAELQQKRSEAYTKYINLLKQRKVTEAREAREEYEQIDQALKAELQSNLQ